MVTEQINESIEVIAHFDGKTVKPLRIKWNGRPYKISKILFKWKDSENGQYVKHRFRVRADSSDIFEISFDTENLKWNLDVVHLEG